MALSNFELYHGAVLTQIVRNPSDVSLKLIERDSEKHGWGMYSIAAGSRDYILVVKSTSRIARGRKFHYCNFTFSSTDIARIDKYETKNLLIALVCKKELIGFLVKPEIDTLKILKKKKSCRVSVYWTKGSQLTVKSSFGEVPHKISRHALKHFKWD
jgi:hypothetical protein